MLYLLKETEFSPKIRSDKDAARTKHFQRLEAIRLANRFDRLSLTVADIGAKQWFDCLLSFRQAERLCLIDPYNNGPGNGLQDIPQLPFPIVLFRCLIGTDSDIIPNGFFDITLSISVIEHIGQKETAFDCNPLPTPDPVQDAIRDDFARELFRITKPGGITFHTIDHAARNLSWQENFRKAGFELYDASLATPTVDECLNHPDAVRQRIGWGRNHINKMPVSEQPLHSVLVGVWRRPI